MTPDDELASGEIEDLRPPGYWGRHVLAKVVIFGALGVAIAGGRFVDGDGGTLLMGSGGIVFSALGLVASVDQMRGLVPPLPGRDMKLLNPLACMAWAAMLMVMCVCLLGTVVFDVDDGEPPGWLIALGILALALAFLGIMIQIGSLSDQWPDKWRPPYARLHPPDAPTVEPKTTEPSDRGPRPGQAEQP